MRWIKSIPKVKGNNIHYGVLNSNRSKKTIVYATRYFDQVLFYDLGGNLLKQHIFSPLKSPPLNQYKFPALPGSFIYAASTFATPDYCFIRRLGNRTTDNPLGKFN